MRPHAEATIIGSAEYPDIKGNVYFFQTQYGVIVLTQVNGLPSGRAKCNKPVFAYHIHSGSKCIGDETDSFSGAMTHYNPNNCSHPYHTGDMPPLFGANGNAFSAFLTNRFNIKEIIGKTVIIHSAPDDFKTQPSGNSGSKIACGEIKKRR